METYYWKIFHKNILTKSFVLDLECMLVHLKRFLLF